MSMVCGRKKDGAFIKLEEDLLRVDVELMGHEPEVVRGPDLFRAGAALSSCQG